MLGKAELSMASCNMYTYNTINSQFFICSTHLEWNYVTGSRHVLLTVRGHFYVFHLLDNEGKMFHPSHYFACVNQILEEQGSQGLDQEDSADGVGALTAEDRDTWAR